LKNHPESLVALEQVQDAYLNSIITGLLPKEYPECILGGHSNALCAYTQFIHAYFGM